jgi:hypothetical protein
VLAAGRGALAALAEAERGRTPTADGGAAATPPSTTRHAGRQAAAPAEHRLHRRRCADGADEIQTALDVADKYLARGTTEADAGRQLLDPEDDSANYWYQRVLGGAAGQRRARRRASTRC